jgi:hypothetical protein
MYKFLKYLFRNTTLFLILKNIKNMATFEDVTAAVTTLSQHITEAETRITATIAALEAQITAGGATQAELQTIVDGIKAADTSVQGIDPVAAPGT